MNRTRIGLISVVCLAVLAGKAWAVCQEPGKVELKPGMKVIAPLAGPNWQVAKIEKISKGNLTVKDADGGLGSMRPNEVVAHPDVLYKSGNCPCFKPGDKVIAKAQGTIWRAATVSKVDGDTIEVQFMDKSKKTLKGNEIVRKP
jgi:hypothetical protein